VPQSVRLPQDRVKFVGTRMMGWMRRATRVGAALSASGAAIALVDAQAVQAHGGSGPDPTLSSIFATWSGDLLAWIAIAAITIGYLIAVLIVNRAHPITPVPLRRLGAWLSGMTIIALALTSAVEVYATDLFGVHMVQHLLLAMVVPPLLALGAPIVLILRVSRPRARRLILLPILHSRLVQAISWPPIGWAIFAVVMWATHFSPLFNAALDNQGLHYLEHVLYLVAGALFWWPVIGADPLRWRLSPGWRMVYLAGQMPVQTAVGLAIYFAPAVLFPHYASLGRTWGPDAYTDQQIAGIVMWGVGDVIMLGALVLASAAWLRTDEKHSHRTQERAARNAEPESAESG
jgi:cytochrome c oxidase assembly factor CtaG